MHQLDIAEANRRSAVGTEDDAPVMAKSIRAPALRRVEDRDSQLSAIVRECVEAIHASVLP